MLTKKEFTIHSAKSILDFCNEYFESECDDADAIKLLKVVNSNLLKKELPRKSYLTFTFKTKWDDESMILVSFSHNKRLSFKFKSNIPGSKKKFEEFLAEKTFERNVNMLLTRRFWLKDSCGLKKFRVHSIMKDRTSGEQTDCFLYLCDTSKEELETTLREMIKKDLFLVPNSSVVFGFSLISIVHYKEPAILDSQTV